MPAPADASRPGPMVPRRYRVAARTVETADTATLTLEPAGEPIGPAAPGQFNMLYAFGIGEVPISFSGLDGHGGPPVHTVRAVGAVSRALWGAEVGATLGVRGPYGTRWDLEAAAGGDVVLMAGGIGLAPLRPVVHRLLAERDRYGRVSVLVGARSPDLLLFPAELVAWSGKVRVATTVDHGDASWRGNDGVVTEVLREAEFDPARTAAFVCGPEVMMRFSARALADAGVDPARIQVSLERNMKCAIVHCGHCQLGP